MAKRGWMPENLRFCRNLLMTVAFAAPLSACVTGTLGFDIIINELVGKNVDLFVLGPGYYHHPRTGKIMYNRTNGAPILKENSDEIIYERRKNACTYAFVVDKKTRLLNRWYFTSADRKDCFAGH